jgi:hypothetical protein
MTVPSGYDFNKRAVVIFVLAMIAATALAVGGTYFVLRAFVHHNPDPLTKPAGLAQSKRAASST